VAGEFQIEPFLRGVSQRLDRGLAAVAESRRGLAPARLVDAMAYALLGGGKRLRPALVLASCEAHGGDASDGSLAMRYALAMECVHTYSLVHDDLPAMDDDDLRRGRPTVHVAFDEATAVLVGDGLQSLAFSWLLADPSPRAAALARLLADGGSLVSYGGMSQKPVQIPASLLIFKNITVRGFWLLAWVRQHSQAERQEMLDKVAAMVKAKQLRLWLERHALSDFDVALAEAQKPFRDRKVVLMLNK